MLAFESAWRVLTAEHGQIRRLLRSIERASESAGDGHEQKAPRQLRALLEDLRGFDSSTHRPKGVILVAALRGRSQETDLLLTELEAEQSRCDHLLDQALEAVSTGGGDPDAGKALERVLQQHRLLLLSHLDKEDKVLRDHAARWLAPEDCSAIVSSISGVVQATGSRPRSQR